MEERNSSRREDLKRELDEVLRGIREMGGVAAIFRDGIAEQSAPWCAAWYTELGLRNIFCPFCAPPLYFPSE